MARRRLSVVVRIAIVALFSFSTVFALLKSPLAASGPLKSISTLVSEASQSSQEKLGARSARNSAARRAVRQDGSNLEVPYDLSGLSRDRGTPEDATPNVAEPKSARSAAAVTPSSTFTVTRSDDIVPRGTCAVGDCTLREAIIAANITPGTDTITFDPALNGVPITLTLTGPDPAEDFAAYGDLDIRESVIITGNGTSNTIIQSGTTPYSGIDKIFGINPDCTASSPAVSVTMTDVTLRNAHNAGPFNAAQFNHTGGAIDYCPSGSGINNFVLTNVIIRDSQVDQGPGAGINISGVGTGTTNITFTNVQVLNNQTMVSTHPTAGGGASIVLNTSAANVTVNITDSIFDGNQALNSSGGGLEIVSNIGLANIGILNIHNTVISNNQAKGAGGGIDLTSTNGTRGTIAGTIDQQSVIKNNVSGAFGGTALGGGIHVETPTPTANLLLSKVTIIGNSNSPGATTQLGGGGIAVGTVAGSFSTVFSRIASNTVSGAGVGSGLRKDSQTGLATAINNWWGCSDGPAAAPCDTAVLIGAPGSLTSSPYLRLHTTATPSLVPLGGTSSLLTRVQDSTGLDTPVANLDVFVSVNGSAGSPLPVTWGASVNPVTPINTVLVSNGIFAQAAATYNANSSATQDPAFAKVDNDFTTGTHTNIAFIDVPSPPVISKTFGAASIPLNGSTSLTFTIQNNNSATTLTGIGFADNLPGGLVVSTPNGLSGSCDGGTISAAAGGTSISLSGASLAPSSSCTFSVNVTGVAAGTQNNTTTNVTSNEGGTGNVATATINVVAPPTIAKSFTPSTIALNGTSSLQFTITNPAGNAVALTGVGFVDNLPAGLTVPNASATVCGGTVTLTAPTTISLTGATISAGSQCVFSVTVTGAASGQYTNTTGNVTSTNGGTGNSASANLTVASAPTISKAFGVSSMPVNATTSLTFNITNPNSGLGLTGVAFTDSLPAGLVVATPAGVTSTCGGTVTATSGSSSISLSGGSIASSGSCSITVNVTATTTGVKVNTTSNVTATESGAGNSASANITITTRTTTTTVSFSSNPSVYGQTISVTATVVDTDAGTKSNPSGTINFSSGAGSDVFSSTTCSLSPVGSDTSTCSVNLTSTTVGTHSVSASYGGSATHSASSGSTNLTVNSANTTSALVSSVNPSTPGQSVTFTVTVTAVAPGVGIPTGTVTFLDGATPIGTATLNGSGVGSFSTSTLTVGTHPITASYAGDGNFNASTSNTVNQVVSQIATTTSLVSSLNPSTFGQSVTFTATVTPSGPGTPTGTVTFNDGATPLGTSPVVGGTASFSTSTLSVGTHAITAVYSGDTTYTGSTSNTVNQVVNKIATSTSLVSSVNPSAFGQSVTFTATVSTGGPGTPTGTVTFSDGATPLATSPLAGGTATFSTAILSVGTHPITATYNGDATFLSSTSNTVNQVVNKAPSSTALVSSQNPSTFGQSVTFTATVTSAGPAIANPGMGTTRTIGRPTSRTISSRGTVSSKGATPFAGLGTPTGTVTFFDGATPIGTGTLDGSGVATFTTSTLSVGTHPITAVYNGDGNFLGSTSNVVNQVVNKANTSTAKVASSVNPSVFGQSVTFSTTVTVVAPGAGTPTGTVTFFDGATNIGSSSVNGSGQASISVSNLAVGNHSITASYGGDGSFNGSTSALALIQTVNKADTTTSIIATPNPATVGDSTTYSITVAAVAPGAGVPTGTVQVKDNGVNVGGPVALVGGSATVTENNLTGGNHVITAVYSGDASFNTSTGTLAGGLVVGYRFEDDRTGNVLLVFPAADGQSGNGTWTWIHNGVPVVSDVPSFIDLSNHMLKIRNSDPSLTATFNLKNDNGAAHLTYQGQTYHLVEGH
jgi:hypothetical protein